MTIITGIRDATYLAQFLGKRIAIKTGENKFDIYPTLHAIFANHVVWVLDAEHLLHVFEWEDCENPYIILTDPRIEWEMK
jgi:hypothetical protein